VGGGVDGVRPCMTVDTSARPPPCCGADGLPTIVAGRPAASSAVASVAVWLPSGSVSGTSLALTVGGVHALPLVPPLDGQVTAQGSAVTGCKSDGTAINVSGPSIEATAHGVPIVAVAVDDAMRACCAPAFVSTAAHRCPVYSMGSRPDGHDIQASKDDVIALNADGSPIYMAGDAIDCTSSGMQIFAEGRGGSASSGAAAARTRTAQAVAALVKSHVLREGPPHTALCGDQTFASLRVCRSTFCRCCMYACCPFLVS
jgi:hypothetical protein